MTPKFIILHHSLTKDSETVSWQAIRDWHINHEKYREIGYHFGLELVQSHGHIKPRHEILVGRMPNDSGAHCKQMGMNRQSLGICFVGNFDDGKPPTEMWLMGLKFVRALMDIYEIPRQNVKGHREFCDYKSCPGYFFNLNKFRESL